MTFYMGLKNYVVKKLGSEYAQVAKVLAANKQGFESTLKSALDHLIYLLLLCKSTLEIVNSSTPQYI